MDSEDSTAGDNSHTDVAEVEPIDLHVCHGKIFVWNASDVKVLREVHHIVGCLVGSLPRAPRQNTQMGLPLQIMPEEANVLLEYGAARLVSVRTHKPNSTDVAKFEEDRGQSFIKQNELWQVKQAKKKEELAHIIEVGRMSRKQRRAEKAKKKKLKQAAAQVKLQAQQESARRDSDLQEASVEHHHNMTEPATKDAANLASFTQSSIVTDDNSETGDPMKPIPISSKDIKVSNTPVNGRRGNEMSENQASCKDISDHRLNDISQTSQEQRTSEIMIQCKDSALLQESQQGQEQSSTCNQVRSSQIESNDMNAGRTSDQALSLSSQVEFEGRAERTCQRIASLQTECEAPVELTSQPVESSQMEYKTHVEDDDNKTNNKQNVDIVSSDQGCLIQLCTGTPYLEERDIVIPDWNFPETPREIMRCRVFQNFWEQGYYMTSGTKFGGDFMAYPGDPFLFHSFYIIVCLPYKKLISPLDIVSFGRMASNVKKTVVLCSVDETDEVVYTSVQWTGIT